VWTLVSRITLLQSCRSCVFTRQPGMLNLLRSSYTSVVHCFLDYPRFHPVIDFLIQDFFLCIRWPSIRCTWPSQLVFLDVAIEAACSSENLLYTDRETHTGKSTIQYGIFTFFPQTWIKLCDLWFACNVAYLTCRSVLKWHTHTHTHTNTHTHISFIALLFVYYHGSVDKIYFF